jgi:hypothetical protein
MKRVIYIGLVAIGFFAVSCSKQTVKPASENSNQIPTWKTTSTDFSGVNSTSAGNGGITDPNNDKDENTRKKN